MQTSYPVFVSNQVLTSQHLNDVVDYLEEQERLSRSKLIGIGIVCGLEVDYEAPDNRIHLNPGCAVTSEGYLIVEGESWLDQFRDYTLPIPVLEEAPAGLVDITRYPFFIDSNGNQIPLWELLPTDYTPAPGETAPTAISSVPGFLDDKVVMLFLECNLESLKNCDINDCSDKGIEMEFTLRKLLLTKTAAQNILEQEKEIAQRPVERHNHPGYDLKELNLAKIGPAASEIKNFAELIFRILAIAFELAPSLLEALNNSYAAYEYLLADMYPPARFPSGPFGDDSYFDNVWSNLLENIFLVEHFYGYMHDLVQAYNEFLRAAITLEADCCPHPGRFPKHILLGGVTPQPVAPVVTFNDPAEVLAFDPLSADSGLGVKSKPEACRHHFIPSLLFARQHQQLQQVRSLHYRIYLLSLRYSTQDLLSAEIKITPSKEGDYPLSSKSIPYYYKFLFGDDLHRNWSFKRTSHNQLEQVFSHQLIAMTDHPLQYRMDEYNFYRIEGIVGKPLGQVMGELLAQQKNLGIKFSIEPVFVNLTFGDDLSSLALNQQATKRAQEALIELIECRMRDLDVVFLLLIATLFYYLFSIATLLSRSNTTAVAGLSNTSSLSSAVRDTESDRTVNVSQASSSQKTIRPWIDRRATELVLKEIRTTTYLKGSITRKVTIADDPKASIGKLYDEIKESPSDTSNLYDRTLAFAQELAPDEPPEAIVQRAQKIYRSLNLLDATEKMMPIVSASSVAEFDFQQFDLAYEGFVRAYDAYVAPTEPEDPNPDPEVLTTQAMLQTNYNAIATTAPQSILNNTFGQIQERIASIFEELTLEGYAKKHPGMVHMGGVPDGGTLILLYTHQEFISNVLEQNSSTINAQLDAVISSFTTGSAPSGINSPASILRPNPTGEALDDFVVLADFCLPYLCCDTDCSDIDLAIPERPLPTPATVTGTVFQNFGTSVPQLQAIEAAEVTVVNQVTNAPVAVQVIRGNFSFQAEPGSYLVEARAEGFISATTVVTIITGSSVTTHNFVLTPATSQPATVKGTIFGTVKDTTRIIESAEVTVTNQNTGAEVEVDFVNGNYSFTVPADLYKIEVSASRFQAVEAELSLKPGSSTERNFTLQQVDGESR